MIQCAAPSRRGPGRAETLSHAGRVREHVTVSLRGSLVST
jgi:hypothetical protein